jgi:hypothetical protein
LGSDTIACKTRPDRQAPFEVGDYIDYSGTLLADEYSLNPAEASPYYISAHTINDHLTTGHIFVISNPDYLVFRRLVNIF